MPILHMQKRDDVSGKNRMPAVIFEHQSVYRLITILGAIANGRCVLLSDVRLSHSALAFGSESYSTLPRGS